MLWFKKHSYLLCYLFLFSCSLADEKLQEDKIKEANLYLTNGECQSALDALNEVNYDVKDTRYIQTLAAAHACKGGFNEVTFFADDIPKIDTDAFLKSLATFSTSAETEVDSTTYTSIKTAVETLVYPLGSVNTGANERKNYYGEIDANDLHLQAVYLLLSFMGKWIYFYGNSNAAGEKGQGTQSNICIYPYNAAALILIDANNTGSCESPYTAHPSLDTATETTADVYRRVCDFIVSLNHVMDIFSNITLSSNTSNGDLSKVLGELTSIKSVLIGAVPSAAEIFELLSYEGCVTWIGEDSGNVDLMEAYFAAFVETNFQ